MPHVIIELEVVKIAGSETIVRSPKSARRALRFSSIKMFALLESASGAGQISVSEFVPPSDPHVSSPDRAYISTP